MDAAFAAAVDVILARATSGEPNIPGVVAMAADRDGIVYEGAAGVRRSGGGEPMTPDSVLALFSCSKAITGAAVLQLVEQGLIDLDAPARCYAPEIGMLEVLEGFDDDGEPRLRPPKRDITTRMLMLHTSGIGYHYFDAGLKRLIVERGEPDPRLGTKRGLMTPLLFDPGERWAYGLGIDWCGQVIEGVLSERLDAVLKARVLEPLGMPTPRSFRPRPCARGEPRCISVEKTAH